MKRVLQLIGIIAGGMLGDFAGGTMSGGYGWTSPAFGAATLTSPYYFNVALGSLLGLMAATAFAGPLIRRMEQASERVSGLPTPDLLSGLGGLVAGLALSALLYPAISGLGWAVLPVSALVSLALGYIGLRVGLTKREELSEMLARVLEARRPQPKEEDGPRYEEHKILDTSVIIDGRIADICKTGFIEGTLVIPEFVLEELQHIADSSDLLKRNRGRRGLDILNKIQKELDVKVLIHDGDFEEIGEVDSKLVKLAKALHGKVVTNDFNLNKVCELQGVSVLNINDLANAVKPVVLPGEEIVVQVIKDGKEHGQGVAYLDDGTMIVVEGGRDYIGTTMEVLVTSVLQTSAGRMIFAKPKLLEKAQ